MGNSDSSYFGSFRTKPFPAYYDSIYPSPVTKDKVEIGLIVSFALLVFLLVLIAPASRGVQVCLHDNFDVCGTVLRCAHALRRGTYVLQFFSFTASVLSLEIVWHFVFGIVYNRYACPLCDV